MKTDANEIRLRHSVGRGEWKSAGGGEPNRTPCVGYAKAAVRNDRRLNTRLSSLLLKYVSGRLKDVLGRRSSSWRHSR